MGDPYVIILYSPSSPSFYLSLPTIIEKTGPEIDLLESLGYQSSGSTAGSHGSNVEPEVLYRMHILHLSLAKVRWMVDAWSFHPAEPTCVRIPIFYHFHTIFNSTCTVGLEVFVCTRP